MMKMKKENEISAIRESSNFLFICLLFCFCFFNWLVKASVLSPICIFYIFLLSLCSETHRKGSRMERIECNELKTVSALYRARWVLRKSTLKIHQFFYPFILTIELLARSFMCGVCLSNWFLYVWHCTHYSMDCYSITYLLANLYCTLAWILRILKP